MYNIPVSNIEPYSSQSVQVTHETFRPQPVYTELAKSFIPLEVTSPLTEIFPNENIWERIVVIDRIFQTVPTIFPVVKWCKPDLFVDNQGRSTVRKYYEPLPIRQSMQICWGEINNTVAEGTMNERANPQDIIANKIREHIRSHNLTWDVYRAMMLNGGIVYTDPRTQVPVNISAMIPPHNLISYNNTSGWNGRNEANLFRSLVDSNAAGNATIGVPFTNPDIAIVDLFRKLKRWCKDTNKVVITDCYCHPDMMEIILMSNEMKLAQGGIVPKFGAVSGDRTTESAVIVTPGSNPMLTNAVGLGASGDLVSIAGINMHTVDTIYKDPVDGIDKRVFPKNKLIFVARVDSEGRPEAPGRTQFCVSENSDGTPGLWTRTEEQTRIPAAPGMAMQMGNAGLPYLKYPDRIIHMKVAEVEEVNARLGLVGDLGFGMF